MKNKRAKTYYYCGRDHNGQRTGHCFFFGSTEVDEYYIQEVERTKAIIEELINEDAEECYYQASW